ncbi:hypothetical protein ElyMa_003006200 [Elysia marginata]|uniref:LITAF domain-containing protein n=1 Tax=Elysia marginata TaxID=1093978 RepID=A0AAV4IIF0_9GAST|nr:hypothetical protein ElyMa_003006200 [Elysia marginata]
MTAIRRPTNIRDILVRSNTPSNNSSRLMPCNTPRCKTCPYTSSTSSFKSSTNGRVFNITLNLSCHSHNIIYLITCTKCKTNSTSGKQKTLSGPDLPASDSTSTTTEAHPWPNILTLMTTPIKRVNIIAIDQLPGSDNISLLNKETHWIHTLGTTVQNHIA